MNRGSSAARTAGAALGAFGMVCGLASPVEATVRERWQVKNEPYAFTTESCGFPIAVHGAFSELAIVREGKGDEDGAFPVVNRLAFTDRYTNTDTGEWFTVSGRSVLIEVRATRVDGDIFEFRFVEAGQAYVVRDSAGDLIARNRGSVHASYLFDTGGDDAPGGEPVPHSLEVIRVAGPHPSFDATFCDIATGLIG